MVTQSPYLLVYSTFNPSTGLNDNPIVSYIGSGGSNMQFSIPVGNASGTSTSRFFGGETLAYSNTTQEWTLTDSQGTKLTFYDLPRSGANLSSNPSVGFANQNLFGKIKSRTDAGGLVTNYTYGTSGTALNQVISIERIDATSGDAERLQYAYTTVSNSLGGSAVLLSSVTHERRSGLSGTFSAIRTASYQYYNGEGPDAANGRLGDLKLVTIRDGGLSGSIIDQKYYRYYKFFGYARTTSSGPTNNLTTTGGTDTTYPRYTAAWNDPFFNIFQSADNSVWSGLRSTVENESFTRMVATVPSYETATDAQIKPYVNNFYRYERWSDQRWNYENYANADFTGAYHYYTRYRVTEEVSQGAGCSTCSGGEGTYRFEFHVNPGQSGAGNGEILRCQEPLFDISLF